MLALALLALLAADDGFGGDTEDDAACVIKGDDGVWRSCDEALAAKKKPAVEEPAEAVDPETAALRERMKAVDEAPAVEPLPKTALEIEMEKARLDVTLPLLALRIDVARAEAHVKRLEAKGTGGPTRAEAEQRAVDARAVLDIVEQIALSRMDNCLVRIGKKPIVKNFRMTAGGPVLLSFREMAAQLPSVDPDGCERITLVDAGVIDKVRHRRELARVLETKSFGYHEVAQRKALETELAALDAELGKGLPAVRR